MTKVWLRLHHGEPTERNDIFRCHERSGEAGLSTPQRPDRRVHQDIRLQALVWYEAHDELDSARLRERQLKKWNRDWKLRLIEEKNPDWLDLYESLF